jgi:hypothetical protein
MNHLMKLPVWHSWMSIKGNRDVYVVPTHIVAFAADLAEPELKTEIWMKAEAKQPTFPMVVLLPVSTVLQMYTAAMGISDALVAPGVGGAP